MTKKANKNSKNYGDIFLRHILSPLIVGIILLLIGAIQVNRLNSEIQSQGAVIQNQKTVIESLESNITNLTNYITVIQQQINVDNSHNRGVVASGGGSISAGRDVIGTQTNQRR